MLYMVIFSNRFTVKYKFHLLFHELLFKCSIICKLILSLDTLCFAAHNPHSHGNIPYISATMENREQLGIVVGKGAIIWSCALDFRP